MKDRKRVMCGGLAFSDCEDMEMLHQYAKEGWVFREFHGLFYILHKEEPVNRIYSYTMQKLAEDEKEAYFRLFEEGGWHILNPDSKEVYFFWAEEGCVPLHSEVGGIPADTVCVCRNAAGRLPVSAVPALAAAYCFLCGSPHAWLHNEHGRTFDGGGHYIAYEEEASSHRESDLPPGGSDLCGWYRPAVYPYA